MQHTLIPHIERTRLHREYVLRVIGVTICVFSVAFLIGAAAIFPTYLRISIFNRTAENTVNTMKNSQHDQTLDKAKAELVADSRLLAEFHVSDGSKDYSDVIRSIILVRQSVTVSTFNLSRTDDKTVDINISGVAPSRNELIAFRDRLEDFFGGSEIEIPIEQLAKNSNLSYNLRFIQKLP